ncbi:FAD-dependent oxidoreductase [Leifsonia sp. SIMBA_070]|uniref:FAD-dependent oxidoreductase n=1 Tax=Leifsonia sp. SIMBA_070 TaxID=3085810 RepID=UPI00397AFB47
MSTSPSPDDRTFFSSRRELPLDAASWPELGVEVRTLLFSAGDVVRPDEHEVLWEAGAGYDLYLVLNGGIHLIDRRDSRVVFVVEAGDFVGELGMLMGQPAFLAGSAMPGSVLLRVRIAEVKRLMAASSLLSDFLMAAFEARRRLLVQRGEGGLVLAGDEGDPDLRRMRAFVERNDLPYRMVPRADREAWGALAASCELPEDGSAVVTGRQRVLRNPTTRELATAFGLDLAAPAEGAPTDLLVVGAGPAGLAAAVYGASEGLQVILVDEVAPGGQAGTSSRIENYLGFARGISGGELTRAATLQAVKFGARLVAPRSVTALRRGENGFVARLDDETEVTTRSVVVATGVQYRELEVPGIPELEGRGVYHAATELEVRECLGSDVVVVGGANSAGQAALFLAQYARRVHVLVRRDSLTETMSSYLAQRLVGHDRIHVHTGSRLRTVEGDDHLRAVVWFDENVGSDVRVEARGLFVMIGAVPRTGWLREAGVELDDRGFVRTDAAYATTVPGVFAVGDSRSGSVKRVASAVGEGSVAVAAVHTYLAGA